MQDRWSSGDFYEPYVGRWSRLVAHEFLGWLNAPLALDWLDVGCGPDALTEAVAERCAPERLAGVDPSDGFLDFARASRCYECAGQAATIANTFAAIGR
jgi:trans-aconitate methyltransferase